MIRLRLAALLCLAGCADLPSTGDGVVILEVATPATLTLRQGESVTLVARALGRDGEEVAVPVAWATPDTTVEVSDAGVVTALTPSGTGRVQASVGSLRSNLITFSLQPPPTEGLRAGP